jgi:MFS family permease
MCGLLFVKKEYYTAMQLTGIGANIWKYVLIQFTNRRNFIPILSVYFLTLADTHANQIGLYTGIGYLASMLMQIPSGYIADHWGQRNTLIIAKIFLLLSSILFLIAGDFWIFTLGAICMSLGNDAFSSGTTASFLK